VNSVAPERSTLRTVLRETCSSRTISLIVLPRTKNSRRIRAIVSTPFIPQPPAPKPEQVARESHAAGGQNCTPIPPLRGSTLHADLHLRSKATRRVGEPVEIVVIQEAGLDGFWI